MNYWCMPSFKTTNVDKEDLLDGLIKRVCKIRNISLEQLKSKTRHRNLVESRYIIFYLLVKYCNYGTKEAGAIFGKEHSTVIHARKTIEDLKEFNPTIKENLESLMDYVKYSFGDNSEIKDTLMAKTSGYRGVSWNNSNKKWRVTIYIKKGENYHVGYYKLEHDAYIAYQIAKKELESKK